MIKGKSNSAYWDGLIGHAADDSVKMRNTGEALIKDGHHDLAKSYLRRAEVAEAHNRICFALGRRANKADVTAYKEGHEMAGYLIYTGWTPPAELILTEEGRRVAVAGLCADADETRPT